MGVLALRRVAHEHAWVERAVAVVRTGACALLGMTIAAGLHPGSSVGKRGRAAEPAGNVIGSLPLGVTLPTSTSAVATPPATPGYHISSTDLTLASQGM
jgi:hypothetical protein